MSLEDQGAFWMTRFPCHLHSEAEITYSVLMILVSQAAKWG